MQPIGAMEFHVQQHAQSAPRLVRAAHQFEGQMMKELLKPLNNGDGLFSGDDSDAGSSSALSDFASEALGQALSQAGGFGIADRIVRQVSHSGSPSGAEQRTADAKLNRGMRSLR